jgi:DUF4097 and DUF4098 domain-containing protein YvlB
MKAVRIASALLILLVFIFISGVSAHDSGEFTKTFPAKSSIKFKGVSADCYIIKGDNDKISVTVEYSYSPSGAFEPILEEKGDKLILQELLQGSCNGSSKWTIAVPDKTRITFATASGSCKVENAEIELSCHTASGDIIIENSKGIYNVETASGDIELGEFSGEITGSTASGDIEGRKVSGDIELSTASGRVDVRDIKGIMSLESASGNVDVTGVIVEDRSYFGTASGNVYVVLSATAEHDIDVASASGDAVLNYGGNAIKGSFEFITQLDHGDISAPIKFDKVEEYRRHGEDYVRKTFEKEGSSPIISITSATGEAALEDR